MGKIFCFIGKSASGKDTIYKEIVKRCPDLIKLVQYTTRPIRNGEKNGIEYYFVSESDRDRLENEGKIIESREYSTIHGKWTYFTVDDGRVDLKNQNYVLIATIDSYIALKNYYGFDNVIPIYISLDDGVRLERAINREKIQTNPCYEEVCRRFLNDQKDFSNDKLIKNGIDNIFINEDLDKVCSEISLFIENC